MSIYKKLMSARMALQGTVLKKSGLNKFAGYNYFELGDFLPTCNKIFADAGLCDAISFTSDIATMTVFDVDSGESIVFTSPMGSAALKGCHEVQNIGAVSTYQRRYLWVTAMGIVEHDALDALDQNAEQKAKDDQKAAYDALVVDKMGVITNIKTGIGNNDLAFAKESWDELNNDEKTALWKAPTKGGIFTTAERTIIQSQEFRTALDSITGAN
jgi:hypothetical protein